MRDLRLVEFGFEIVAFDDTDLAEMRNRQIAELDRRFRRPVRCMENTDRDVANSLGEMEQGCAILAIGTAS